MSNTPNLERVLIAAEKLRGKESAYDEKGFRLQGEIIGAPSSSKPKVHIRSADNQGKTERKLREFDPSRNWRVSRKPFDPEVAVAGFIGRITREVRSLIDKDDIMNAINQWGSAGGFQVYMPKQAFLDAGVLVDSVEREILEEIRKRLEDIAVIEKISFEGITTSQSFIDVKWQKKNLAYSDKFIPYYERIALPWDAEEFGNTMPGLMGEEIPESEKNTALKTYLGISQTDAEGDIDDDADLRMFVGKGSKSREDDTGDEDKRVESGHKRSTIGRISSLVATSIALALIMHFGKDHREQVENIQKVVAAKIGGNCRVDFTPPNKYTAECAAPYEARGEIQFPKQSPEQEAAGKMPVAFYVTNDSVTGGTEELTIVEVEDMYRTHSPITVFEGKIN